MDSSYSFYLNLITAMAGVYVLYVWFRLKREGRLFENQLLIPKGSKASECLDEENFIRYISLRLLILGIACTISGVISAVDDQTGFLSQLFPQVEKISLYVGLGSTLLALLVLIWYAICWTKCRKEYWVTGL